MLDRVMPCLIRWIEDLGEPVLNFLEQEKANVQ